MSNAEQGTGPLQLPTHSIPIDLSDGITGNVISTAMTCNKDYVYATVTL